MTPRDVWLQPVVIDATASGAWLATDHRDPSSQWLPTATTDTASSSKHRFEHTSTSRALSADFDSIWTSVLVWEGGSTVKRITQNSPTRCSLTPCQLLLIHPSISRPFFGSLLTPSPSVRLSLSLFFFYPCLEDYIVLLSPVSPAHPPIFLPSLLSFPFPI